jgi:hypothetical protein
MDCFDLPLANSTPRMITERLGEVYQYGCQDLNVASDGMPDTSLHATPPDSSKGIGHSANLEKRRVA